MSGVKFAEKAPARGGTMAGIRYWQNYTILVEVQGLHLYKNKKGFYLLEFFGEFFIKKQTYNHSLSYGSL